MWYYQDTESKPELPHSYQTWQSFEQFQKQKKPDHRNRNEVSSCPLRKFFNCCKRMKIPCVKHPRWQHTACFQLMQVARYSQVLVSFHPNPQWTAIMINNTNQTTKNRILLIDFIISIQKSQRSFSIIRNAPWF